MKKTILFALLFVSALTFAQKSINDYQYAIVPVKFDWMSKENQYRVSTLTKLKLTAIGFRVFYDNERLPEEVASGRCDKLYIDIERTSSFLATKLVVVFKDCQNGIVLKSSPGVSKKKEFDEAYMEALTAAFSPIEALNYKYNGGTALIKDEKPEVREMAVKQNTISETPAPISAPAVSGKLSYETTANGLLVVEESTSVIKFKLSKTTNPDVFIAVSQGRQGVLLKKGGNWFFEYYSNDKLVSEQTDLKF